MGDHDHALMTCYGVSLRVRGVMYRVREPGDKNELHMAIVLQDALGDYYFSYENGYHGGDFLVAKFRHVPRGTAPQEFVKHYFKGAVKGVDMDEIHPREDYNGPERKRLRDEQVELARLFREAQSQSACACANWQSDPDMVGKSKFAR
jgi:hypothetical protein